MHGSAIREAFRAFAGEARFRKFVHAINTRCPDRLLFWQDKLWQEFVVQNPHAHLQFDALREAFHFCEIHGCELGSEASSEHIEMLPLLPYRYPFPNVRDCPMCRQGEQEWARLPRAERAAVAKKTKLKGSA